MARVEKSVFLSYRRTNASWALAIYQYLTQNGFDVFIDFNGVASGDFERVILENLRARAHFLIVLTPSALERCCEPGDWLRREIEEAIGCRRNIVPVMLESFDFGAPAIAPYLTGRLAELKSYNGLRVSVDYFEAAMGKLRDRFLNVPLDAVLHPASDFAQGSATEHQVAAAKAPAVKASEFSATEWFEKGIAATDPQKKYSCFSNALRLEPNYVAAYINRGVARYGEGELEGAIQDYNAAIRLQPDCVDAYNNRGAARHKKGDFDRALEDYNEAIRLDPDYVDAYFNRGMARHEKADIEGAVLDYSAAIRLQPDYVYAYFKRGLARSGAADFEGAVQDYSAAIRLRPDYLDAYYNRGLSRYGAGDFEGAIQDYSSAIRLNPDRVDAYNNRAIARNETGDFAGAVRDCSEAIRLKPDFVYAYINRGAARNEEGDFEAALEDCNEALRLDPESVNAYCTRGMARHEKGDFAGAIRDYSEAIRLKPDCAYAYIDRGSAREAKGDIEGALQDYTEAIGLDPDDVEAYDKRANAREAKGDINGALRDRATIATPHREKPAVKAPPTSNVPAKPGARMFEQLKRGIQAFRPDASWAVYAGKSFEGWWFLTDPNGQRLVRVKPLTNLLRVRIHASSGNQTDPVNFDGWILENESSVIRDDKDVARILKQIRSEWP